MSLHKECKPIASSGLGVYLAIYDAIMSCHEDKYKDAYNAAGNAIGEFLTMFNEKTISYEELDKLTKPRNFIGKRKWMQCWMVLKMLVC